MTLDEQIAAGRALVAALPGVIDHALIGSAMYLPTPNDVDFAVLVPDDCISFADQLARDGWGNCGEYDSTEGVWCAIRREGLNLMVTHDRGFFDRYKTAMEVCKALRLEHKEDRIAVCQIVRDGLTADQVTTHAQIAALGAEFLALDSVPADPDPARPGRAWWLTFKTGAPACMEASTEAEARSEGAQLAGREVVTCDRLPYPATPRLRPYADDTGRVCPAFCFMPESCRGATACPQRYSCTE